MQLLKTTYYTFFVTDFSIIEPRKKQRRKQRKKRRRKRAKDKKNKKRRIKTNYNVEIEARVREGGDRGSNFAVQKLSASS